MLSCVQGELFFCRFEVARLSFTIRLALNLLKRSYSCKCCPLCVLGYSCYAVDPISESIVTTTPTAIWQVFEWFWMQAGVPPACIGLPVRHNAYLVCWYWLLLELSLLRRSNCRCTGNGYNWSSGIATEVDVLWLSLFLRPCAIASNRTYQRLRRDPS